MDEYTATISVRMPVSMVKDLDEDVKMEGYADRSDAIRSLVIAGRRVHQIKKMINEPGQLQNVLGELENKRKNETLAEWFKTLNEREQTAIIDMMQLVKDGKWLQTPLVNYSELSEKK